ncbi:MAG: 50S ribosomal protein L17 [Opitutia bacterium UBA7350]|nr:MAG: 50S ribosomal protein L17 [Opitutae bacterium UBA7350]
MRHSKRRHVLGVTGPHRAAMMGNLSVALITHGRIETTLSKAKALRPFIEKVITLAKKADQANDAARKLHYRRLAVARVRDKKAVAMLFDERASEFAQRPGGYTRIYKIGQRIGDAAEMALIELIDASDEGYEKPKRKAAPKAKATSKAKAKEGKLESDAEAETPEAEAPEAEPKAEAEEAAPEDGPEAEAPETETESSEAAEDSESKKES